MINSLRSTLRSWIGKYGSEAAFVGRVAVAAVLPPGTSKLVEAGLEAAFEYLQGKSDVVGDHELSEKLDELGIAQGPLNQVVHRIDSDGELVLQQAFKAHQNGLERNTIENDLRTLIDGNPALSAMRTALEQVAHHLHTLSQQQEVLIAGQSYQTVAIEEMMRMIQAIATQVGASALANESTVNPTAMLSHEHIVHQQSKPLTDSLESTLSSNASVSSSTATSALDALDALSALKRTSTTSSTQANPSISPLANLGSHTSQAQSSSQSRSLNPLSPVNTKATPSLATINPTTPQSNHEITQTNHELTQNKQAKNLVERFYQVTHQKPQVKTQQAVDLVTRFQNIIAQQKPQTQTQVETPQVTQGTLEYVGFGKVALCLHHVGTQPIAVVKWLCEAWGYSLTDAIIATQQVPCIIKRDNDFVALARAQNALKKIGAHCQLTV